MSLGFVVKVGQKPGELKAKTNRPQPCMLSCLLMCHKPQYLVPALLLALTVSPLTNAEQITFGRDAVGPRLQPLCVKRDSALEQPLHSETTVSAKEIRTDETRPDSAGKPGFARCTWLMRSADVLAPATVTDEAAELFDRGRATGCVASDRLRRLIVLPVAVSAVGGQGGRQGPDPVSAVSAYLHGIAGCGVLPVLEPRGDTLAPDWLKLLLNLAERGVPHALLLPSDPELLAAYRTRLGISAAVFTEETTGEVLPLSGWYTSAQWEQLLALLPERRL